MATFIELTDTYDDKKLVINIDNVIKFYSSSQNDSESIVFYNVIFGGNGASKPAMTTVKESYNDIKNIITKMGNEIGVI